MSSPQTALFGVGVGGFGTALHERYPSYPVGSIVNNTYLELLVEIGVIGLSLFIATLGYVAVTLYRNRAYVGLGATAAFSLQWLFFSGSANVLHVWVFFALASGLHLVRSANAKQKSATINTDAT